MNQNDFENLPKTEGQAPAKVKVNEGGGSILEESDDEKIKRLKKEVKDSIRSTEDKRIKYLAIEVKKNARRREKTLVHNSIGRMSQKEVRELKEFEELPDEEKIRILTEKVRINLATGSGSEIDKAYVDKIKDANGNH